MCVVLFIWLVFIFTFFIIVLVLVVIFFLVVDWCGVFNKRMMHTDCVIVAEWCLPGSRTFQCLMFCQGPGARGAGREHSQDC